MDMDVSARLIRVRETDDHSRHTSIMLDSIECVIPVECVVRNICAGSMAQRYGIPEGTKLREPVFEFFLESDSLHDPLCQDDRVRVLGWATIGEIAQMKTSTKCSDRFSPTPASISSRTSWSSATRCRIRKTPSCWATSSLPMVVGSGTRRPVKKLTRTGCAAISAKASNVIERWAGGSALRCIRFRYRGGPP